MMPSKSKSVNCEHLNLLKTSCGRRFLFRFAFLPFHFVAEAVKVRKLRAFEFAQKLISPSVAVHFVFLSFHYDAEQVQVRKLQALESAP